MDHPSEIARVIIDANHQNMTKFKGPSDANYRRVQQHIIALVGEARAHRLGQLAQGKIIAKVAVVTRLIAAQTKTILSYGRIWLEHNHPTSKIQCSPKSRSSVTVFLPSPHNSIAEVGPPSRMKDWLSLRPWLDSYAAAIEAHFKGADKRLRSLALHGMAGVGKTQLALSFANSHRDQYPAIFWVHADQDQKMAQDYDDFAKNLSLDLGGTDGQLQNRAKFKNWLIKEPTSWLLIFDNVDNLASIKPFWPSAGHGSIIVTAKNPEAITSLVQKSIHLEPFSEKEGAKYLLSRLSDPSSQDESLATVIAKKLGGLPIALSHVAGFIEATSCTFEELLDMYSYRADPAELMDYDSSEITFDYEGSYATLWKVSFESLGKEATQLLEMLALLDPDSIPEGLLRDESKAINEKPRLSSEAAKYRKAVSQLRRHALIAKDVRLRTLSIHRLVQEATTRDWESSKLQSVFSAVSQRVSECFPRQIGGASMSKDWEKCAKYAPHLLSLARHYQHAEPPLERSLDFAEVLSHCAWYLYEQGQIDGAFGILLLARDTCISVLGDQPHLTTAHVYNNLSAMYMFQGERQECANTSLLVCTIREKLLGPDHVDVAQALANYATDLNALDQLEDADEVYRKALRIRELPQNSNTEPELLGQLLSNAGRCWARIGRYPEAEDALKRAIALRRQSLGVHNATAISYYGLGNTVLAQGHLDAAMAYHQVCLDMRRELNMTTYWLGVSCHKLAVLHHQKGQNALAADTRKEQNDIAVDLLREAIINFKQAQSEPGLLARSLFRLSALLLEVEDDSEDEHAIQESRELYDEAIEAAGESFPENPTEQDYEELVQFDHR